ncbi:helix-turn-helix transcriptional regulator [Candidatus Fukatsuia endosymbiont of Tuberolachnus salignus]|uniref:helix-turn-helix transcriptional regulator n=1 Tax=Candidatus Fukatsuia endosymbiont of Tuberolachnus salignus TaxID=3077957 RepID=UPI00313EDA75
MRTDNNAQYTTDEISKQLILLCENSADPWGIKDNESRYLYANKAWFELLNLPANFSLKGRLGSDIPHLTAKFACYFQEHDRQVRETQQSLSSLDIYPYGRKQIVQPYICEKSPLYNEAGKCIGIIFHSRKCAFFSALQCINGELPHLPVFHPTKKLFSKKELEVIFFALYSLSAKEIAKKLHLSHRTIENTLQKIYRKAGIHFLNQLITFCKTKGLDNYIPPQFLPIGSQPIGLGVKSLS